MTPVALQSLLGLVAFIAMAWALGEKRRAVNWKMVAVGVGLQLALALLLLKAPFFATAIAALNSLVLAIERATEAGATMVFGYLGGGELPFDQAGPGSVFILAFRALPIILVISAISSLLFYWKILPAVIGLLARALQKSLRIGGAEGLGLAANIFVGMVESPILIRPYVERLSRSELFSIMTCGMATIAGTVMVLYASILADAVPGALGHILVASVVSIPAAYVIAKIMIPETAEPTPARLEMSQEVSGSFEAIVDGTTRGVRLLVNVVAMILVMVALVELVNIALALLPADNPPTLQGLLGVLLAPVTWLIGVPWDQAPAAGQLLGTKTVINEFVAYLDLASLDPGELDARSRTVMMYALCGFANPGSIGILVGGLASIAPSRRAEIVGLAWRSLVAGTLATCMTGAVANLFFSA